MPTKETPLLDAEEKLGPLPGFLFINPVIAGFFAIMMAPLFGAVFTSFWGMLGAPSAIELFDDAIFGAAIALAFAGIVLVGILVSALFASDERSSRLQFVLGGAAAIALLMICAAVFLPGVRAWLIENNPPMWTGD